MDHNVIVSDYAAMDRVLKEERTYILNIVKQIKKSGCNVLLVQKSILRDAVSDLAIHFLDKIKVMVVKDIEREDIEFVCKVRQIWTWIQNKNPFVTALGYVPLFLAKYFKVSFKSMREQFLQNQVEIEGELAKNLMIRPRSGRVK